MTAKPTTIRRARPVLSASDPVLILPGESVPDGVLTFGQVIRESVAKFDRDRKESADESHHQQLYGRWLRIYARALRAIFPVAGFDQPAHAIYTDIREWEWFVCRWLAFDVDAVTRMWFFDRLEPRQRRRLCELSRETRKIERSSVS